MTDDQELFQQTEYQILRNGDGYDLLHKGKVVRSFGSIEEGGLDHAISNVSGRLSVSTDCVTFAPLDEDNLYLFQYECKAGTVFVTSKPMAYIMAECDAEFSRHLGCRS